MKADFPSNEAFAQAAATLGCALAAVRAFAHVEAGPQGAFLPSGEPVILFERHKFRQYTGGRFDHIVVRHPETGKPLDTKWAVISAARPSYLDQSYGPMSKQHLRLQAAAALDRDAALKSASWGLFQIMGSNYEVCGFHRLQDFITAMYRSADDHLFAFVKFIQHTPRLASALREEDWATAARLYNGPQFKKLGYDTRLARAYESFSGAGVQA